MTMAQSRGCMGDGHAPTCCARSERATSTTRWATRIAAAVRAMVQGV